VTLRHLLVFGVCAVGVSCLYLVPSVAGSGHPVSSPRPHDEPTLRPSERVVRDAAATAFDPAERPDHEPPEAVGAITSTDVSATSLTISWPAASDDVGVVGYTVLLDGFEVATTQQTHATLRWFNDDAREHVLQVRALDGAGNRSPASPNLLLSRPVPGPTQDPALSGDS
jgi:hypothetical protein